MKKEIKIELVDGGYILSYPVPLPNAFGMDFPGKLVERKAIVKTRKALSKTLETVLDAVHKYEEYNG